MNESSIDKFTAKLFIAIQILLLEHPVRTSCAIIITSIFYLGFDVYPVVFEIMHAKNNIKSKMFFCMIIFSLCNIKTISQSLRGKYMDEKTEKMIHSIQTSGLNKVQRDMQMAALLNRMISEVNIRGKEKR